MDTAFGASAGFLITSWLGVGRASGIAEGGPRQAKLSHLFGHLRFVALKRGGNLSRRPQQLHGPDQFRPFFDCPVSFHGHSAASSIRSSAANRERRRWFQVAEHDDYKALPGGPSKTAARIWSAGRPNGWGSLQFRYR